MGDIPSCCGGSSSKKRLVIENPPEKVDPIKAQLPELNKYLTHHIFILDDDLNFNQHFKTRIITQFTHVTVIEEWHGLQDGGKDYHHNHLLIFSNSRDTLNRSIPNYFAYRSIAYVTNCQETQAEKKKYDEIYRWRYSGMIEMNWQVVSRYLMEKLNEKRSLLFCDKDRAMLNRTYISQHCFFNTNKQYPLKDFLEFLQYFGPDFEQIRRKIAKTREDELDDYLLQLYLENSLFSKAMDKILQDNNPFLVPYVAWLYSRLFNHINDHYNQFKNKLRLTQSNVSQTEKTEVPPPRSVPNEFFLVVELSQEDQARFKDKRAGSSFMFGSMPTGVTMSKHISQNRNNNTFVFNVNVPIRVKDFAQDRDHGFVVRGQRVVCNLMNFFRVDEVRMKERQIDVTYSSIGMESLERRRKYRYAKDATSGNQILVKQYDFLCYLKTKVKKQFDLIFTLQMYDSYKEAVITKVSQFSGMSSRSSESSQSSLASSMSTINITLLPSDDPSEKMGDVERAKSNLLEAENHYKFIKLPERGKVNILDMYMGEDTLEQYNQHLQQLVSNLNTKFKNQYTFLNKAVSMYLAEAMLANGEYARAEKKIQSCFISFQKDFDDSFQELHNEASDALPLKYKLTKTRQRIARKLGIQDQVKSYQKEMNKNWPVFDGVHFYWLL